MAIDDVPVSYQIKFEKDHANVKVTYDLSVPVGGPALIADFQATVDGTRSDQRLHPRPECIQRSKVSYSRRCNEGRDRFLLYFFQPGLERQRRRRCCAA